MLDNKCETPTSMTSLVGGIIQDAQKLIRQEMELAKREIKEEVNKAKTAAISLLIGAATAGLGAILLLLTVVYFLNWISDGRLPLWGCYGIVGGFLIIVGGGLLYAARNKASTIHIVPERTVETMRENVQWIKNQT